MGSSSEESEAPSVGAGPPAVPAPTLLRLHQPEACASRSRGELLPWHRAPWRVHRFPLGPSCPLFPQAPRPPQPLNPTIYLRDTALSRVLPFHPGAPATVAHCRLWCPPSCAQLVSWSWRLCVRLQTQAREALLPVCPSCAPGQPGRAPSTEPGGTEAGQVQVQAQGLLGGSLPGLSVIHSTGRCMQVEQNAVQLPTDTLGLWGKREVGTLELCLLIHQQTDRHWPHTPASRHRVGQCGHPSLQELCGRSRVAVSSI